MPEIDGFEATEGILRMDRNAKVVMFSPIVSAKLIEKALSIGAREYITSPVNLDEATRIIKAVMQ
jgi:DNA-binding NarL/FixJ family response regulator